MKRIFLSSIIFCLSIVYCSAQIDTDFWFGAPYITNHHDGKPVFLRFATFASTPTTVTLSQPANLGSPLNQSITIQPNTSQSIDLTPYLATLAAPNSGIIETGPNYNTVYNTGLHITSDQPITVYYEILGNNSEIYALKGKNALGTKFYTPFQNIWTNFYGNYVDENNLPTTFSGIIVVASEDATDVTITPTDDILGSMPGDTIGPNRAKKSINVRLDKGQTYYVQAAYVLDPSRHISGTLVEATKPIAVSTKDDSANLGKGDQASADPAGYDLIGDQIIPVNVVGTEYIAIKGDLGNATGEDRLFIVPTIDATSITINGVTLPGTYNAGKTFVYQLQTDYAYVETSQPAYVFHVTGFRNELAGTVLPPIRCTGARSVAITRSNENIAGTQVFYLNFLVRENGLNNFKINGKSYPELASSQFTVIDESLDPDNKWYFAHILIPESVIPKGANALITNDVADFHVGALFGLTSTSARYGYFSDFEALELGPNITLCRDQSVTLHAGLEKSPWNWTWDNGKSKSATEAITVSGQSQVKDSMYYSVKVCNKFTDSVLVHYISLPDTMVTVVGPLSFCPGDSVTLEAIAGYKYQWRKGGVDLPNDTLRTLTAKESGIYSVSLKDKNPLVSCVRVSKEFNVIKNETPNPVVLGEPSDSICNGSSVTLNVNTTKPSDGKFKYQWIKGATAILTNGDKASLTVSLPGNYSVLVTDTSKSTRCNAMSDTVHIKVKDPLNLTLIPAGDQHQCLGNSVITLTASGTGTLHWFLNGVEDLTKLNANTYDAKVTGAYKVTLTDASGKCSQSLVKNVSFEKSSFAKLPAPQSFCVGESVVIDANPKNGATFIWLKDGVAQSDTGSNYTVKAEGAHVYGVIITQDGTCIDTAYTTVTGNPKPADFTVTSGGSVCTSDSPVLTANTAEDGLKYQWFKDGIPFGTNSKTITVTEKGEYTVTVATTIGCSKDASDSIQINTSPTVSLTVEGKEKVCMNEPNLKYYVSQSKSTSTYTWSVNQDASIISGQNSDTIYVKSGINPTFVISVKETSGRGCPGKPTLYTVNVDQNTLANQFPSDTSVCDNTSLVLSTSTAGTSYQWYMNGSPIEGETHSSYLAKTTGNYFVKVQNGYCKLESKPSVLKINPSINIKVTTAADTVCEKTEATITATASGGTAPFKYDWYKAGSTTTLATDASTLTTTDGVGVVAYTVKVQDNVGCTQTKTDTITYVNTQHLVVPNLITPNPHSGHKPEHYDLNTAVNDNDILFIRDEKTGKGIYPGASFELFNKWGKRVYMNTNYDNKWGADGINDGIYYYYIKTGCGNQEYKGWLQILNNENN